MSERMTSERLAAAMDALENGQRQLDEDGVFVGVSRQAIHEVLAHLRSQTPPHAQAVTRQVLRDAVQLLGRRILNVEMTMSQHREFADAILALLAEKPAPVPVFKNVKFGEVEYEDTEKPAPTDEEARWRYLAEKAWAEIKELRGEKFRASLAKATAEAEKPASTHTLFPLSYVGVHAGAADFAQPAPTVTPLTEEEWKRCAKIADQYSDKANYGFDLGERHGLLLAQARKIAKAIRE